MNQSLLGQTSTLRICSAKQNRGLLHSTRRQQRWLPRWLIMSGLWFILFSGFSFLSACGQGGHKADTRPPVAITTGDMCAVCGMIIVNYPGPRAEAYLEGQAKPLKFGGTSDFFAFILQPENVHHLGALYVQDMAITDWQHPSNDPSTFTDARKAWYVADQPLPGEMGPTLASFRRREDAEAFIHKHGGRLVQFQDVTPDLISHLTQPAEPGQKHQAVPKARP